MLDCIRGAWGLRIFHPDPAWIANGHVGVTFHLVCFPILLSPGGCSFPLALPTDGDREARSTWLETDRSIT